MESNSRPTPRARGSFKPPGAFKGRVLRLWASTMIALAALAGPAVSSVFATTVNCVSLFGAPEKFAIGTISSPQFEGDGAFFDITITALFGTATCTDYTGTANLSVSGGPTITPTVTGAFTSGVRTESVVMTGTGTMVSITATTVTQSGTSSASNTFAVNANTVDTATKLNFTNDPITVGANAISGVFTVELNDGNGTAGNGTASTGNTYPVVLTSDSPGTVTFYKGSTGTTVLGGGCTTIPKGQTSVTFRYKDSAPSTTRMLAAFNMTLTDAPTACKTGTPNLTTGLTQDTDAVDVQVAPKSVTITGVGFGTGGTVEWGATTLSSATPTDMCATTLPVANTPPCLKPWPASGKSVTLIPPPGDLGTTVGVTVNGGVASAEADNYLTTKARFYYGPLVADVSPLSGDALGGTPVTISGIDLGPKPVVNFGSVPIDTGDDTQKCGASGAPPQTACWKSNNATKIVVLAPAGSGTALVTVVGGVVHDEADNTYRYGTAVITGLKAVS